MTDLCKHELSKHICIRCCRTERDALAAELAQWKNDNLEIAGKFTKANYRIRDLEAALLTILGKSWTAHDLSLLIHPLLPFTQLETKAEQNFSVIRETLDRMDEREAESKMNFDKDDLGDCHSRIDELEAALWKYGKHRATCALWASMANPCTCGWVRVRETLAPAQQSPEDAINAAIAPTSNRGV